MEAPNTSPDTGDVGLTTDIDKMPGHWVLARMGKRILRPGGKELTGQLMDALNITSADDVVELAPGLGMTTRLVLDRQPRSYVGIERDEAAAKQVSELLTAPEQRCEVATAQQSGLEDNAASVVFGEAYLTMQSDEARRKMLDEAFRILRPGGRFGLHELSLRPNDLGSDEQDRIRGELARSIRVGARPATVKDWETLVEDAGFAIDKTLRVEMGLLHPRRLIDDEGLLGTAKIIANVVRNRAARARILGMRKTFTTNADNLGAVALMATKPD